MNMDAISHYFDHYVISARIKPAFFVVLPLVVTAIIWWPDAQQLGGVVLTLLAMFGMIGFFSNYISNRGNELQDCLFAEWGGAPTTALLRFGDPHLDPDTRERYHRRLEKMIPGLKMPSHKQEQKAPFDADTCYASAASFLREHTRNKTRYPLVYADNVAYGYARNLLVMKLWGIVIAACSVALNIAFLYPGISTYLQMEYLGPLAVQLQMGLGATAVSVLMFGVFAFAVNREYVRGRAVRYARSLLAACEVDGQRDNQVDRQLVKLR